MHEEMKWELSELYCILCDKDRSVAIKLFYRLRLIFINKIFSTIKHLQRTNESVQKFLDGLREQMVVRMLISHIKRYGWIDYNYLNEVYIGFVERKRQALLKDIEKIDNQSMKNIRERQGAGLPNEGLPAETRMKQAVLDTCYAYLKGDDAYQQKAFRLFLKKKMEDMAENGADCSKIEAYLKNKRKDSSYEEYIECISMPVTITLPKLWVEFFRSGARYTNMLPKEWPNVAYFSTSTDVPNFIFEPPYVDQYSAEEFSARYAKEWETTHYNPDYDDNYDYEDPTECMKYRNELAGSSVGAYCQYIYAVSLFRRIQQALKLNAGKN